MRTQAERNSNGHGDDIFENYKGLITVKQLADILAVSEKMIYAHVAQGRIPYVKIGSSIRFRPRAIREWLERREFVPMETGRR